MPEWIEDLFAYVDTFDPGWRADTLGASAADTARWAELTGLELPDEYRAFLAVLGGHYGDAGLFHDSGVSFDVADLIEEYAEIRGPDNQPMPCLPIAISHDQDEYGLHVTETGERQIVFLGMFGRPGRLLHESLSALCFYYAFLWEQVAARSYARTLAAPNGAAALATVDRLVDRGYERQWFSTDDWCLLRRADTLISVGVTERGMWAVGGRDRAAIDAGLADVSAATRSQVGWNHVEREPLPAVRAQIREWRAENAGGR
jgi:SMI1/KNR4 family protein SUKH-1